MSNLRVFLTPAGPMCGSCVETKYNVEIQTTDGPIGYDVEHDEVYAPEIGHFRGDHCVECHHIMPADGAPEGRRSTRPNVVMGEYLMLTFADDQCTVRATERGIDFAKIIVEEDEKDVDRVLDDDGLDNLLFDIEVGTVWGPVNCTVHHIVDDSVVYVVGERMDSVKALAQGKEVVWHRAGEVTS